MIVSLFLNKRFVCCPWILTQYTTNHCKDKLKFIKLTECMQIALVRIRGHGFPGCPNVKSPTHISLYAGWRTFLHCTHHAWPTDTWKECRRGKWRDLLYLDHSSNSLNSTLREHTYINSLDSHLHSVPKNTVIMKLNEGLEPCGEMTNWWVISCFIYFEIEHAGKWKTQSICFWLR